MQPVIPPIYQYDYREVSSASPIIYLLLSHEAVKPNQPTNQPGECENVKVSESYETKSQNPMKHQNSERKSKHNAQNCLGLVVLISGYSESFRTYNQRAILAGLRGILQNSKFRCFKIKI